MSADTPDSADEPTPPPSTPLAARLREVAAAFFKLGLIAFGGPAAHVAMMEEEFVTRRRWVSRQHFLDLMGATQLVPGPNSTEMTMHLGCERAGRAGLLVAGTCFIGPAVVITGMLAWAYVEWGSLPAARPILDGIQPAVLAVIALALWKLGKKAIKNGRLAIIAAACLAMVAAGLSEVVALAIGGIVGALWLRTSRGLLPGPSSQDSKAPKGDDKTSRRGLPLFLAAARPRMTEAAAGTATAATAASLSGVFLFFLKVGAILYGSGYVLVAFLEGGLVEERGWLTHPELLDAIAIGQFTPGPILSTATFIGYLVAGVPGAALATLGIFLPSFVFVTLLNPIVPRLRKNPTSAAFLDAINAAAVALMAWVTLRLGTAILVDPISVGITLLALVAAIRFKVKSMGLVLGGAMIGGLRVALGF